MFSLKISTTCRTALLILHWGSTKKLTRKRRKSRTMKRVFSMTNQVYVMSDEESRLRVWLESPRERSVTAGTSPLLEVIPGDVKDISLHEGFTTHRAVGVFPWVAWDIA